MTHDGGAPADPDRPESAPLRILIANATPDRARELATLLAALGHEAIPRELASDNAGVVTAIEQVDVALVDVGSDSTHALDLIATIASEATCPVIALLQASDSSDASEAAGRGAFAAVVGDDGGELQGAIDVALHRFAEVRTLQGAFGRRATIEQAKGILMARHRIDAASAFDLLRDQSQRSGLKLLEVSRAVVDSHLLLVPELPPRHPGDR